MLYICLTSCFLSWYSMNNFIYNRNPQPYLLSAGCKIVHLFCLLISIRFGSWLLHWNFYNDPLSSHHTQINWTYSLTLFHFTLTFWRPCHPPFPSSTYMLYIYTTITFHFYIASNSNNFFQNTEQYCPCHICKFGLVKLVNHHRPRIGQRNLFNKNTSSSGKLFWLKS